MKKLVALLVALSFTSFACYNTYHTTIDQMKSLQTAEGGENKGVETQEGKNVEVKAETRLFVRDTSGKKYMITPYNFKMTASQLVASDRDYIFMLDQLKGGGEGEIELLSTPKTILLIAGGAVAVAGLIAVTVITAGKKSFKTQD
jgi:hypothetical protein